MVYLLTEKKTTRFLFDTEDWSQLFLDPISMLEKPKSVNKFDVSTETLFFISINYKYI